MAVIVVTGEKHQDSPKDGMQCAAKAKMSQPAFALDLSIYVSCAHTHVFNGNTDTHECKLGVLTHRHGHEDEVTKFRPGLGTVGWEPPLRVNEFKIVRMLV